MTGLHTYISCLHLTLLLIAMQCDRLHLFLVIACAFIVYTFGKESFPVVPACLLGFLTAF